MSTASSSSQIPRSGAGAADHVVGRASERSRLRRLAAGVRPELALLVLVAAFLNLWNLSVNGEANTYYSAAVKSMSESWSAFFWGTFDPAGLMTVDKPPLALWVQAASVRVFGWSSWSYLVPQALMGIAAVALTYDVTRRAFGRAGGFAAGLALALTPTAVAMFRHNNPDAALMLCITLALWATVRGLETGRTRWLVWAGVAVGLGFEAKMAAALMVVPAIGAAWLWVRPGGTVRRTIGQLVAFSASAAAVGLAWPLAVALTPASDRPWVSGTSDNSIWSLIFGYNGLGRLLGQDGGPGGGAGGPGGGGGGMGSVFGGSTGPLRLLNESLGSQGGWLLGMAIGSGLLVLIATRLRRADLRTGWLIATGGAFAISAVAFSFASGIFHPYYVSALAPFTAALVGAGVGSTLALARGEALGAGWTPGPGMLGSRRDDTRAAAPGQHDGASAAGGIGATDQFAGAAGEVPEQLWAERDGSPRLADDRGLDAASTSGSRVGASSAGGRGEARLLAGIAGAALVGGAVSEAVVLSSATQLTWLSPVLIVGTLAAAATLVVVRSSRVRMAAVIAATSLLLVAPGVWSAQTIGHNVGSTFPTGGPASTGGMGGPGGGMGGRMGGMGGRGGAGGGMGQPPQGFGGGGASGQMAPSAGSSTTGGGSTASGGSTTGGGFGGPGGGGGFGGDQSSVSSALAYAKANGGGTLVVSGQSGAASSILASGANVAGMGGFSGRESEVSIGWFADRVASGNIRWVLTSSGGIRDSRTGSNTVMGAVTSTCEAVSSVDGLYDCQGQDSALRSAAS